MHCKTFALTYHWPNQLREKKAMIKLWYWLSQYKSSKKWFAKVINWPLVYFFYLFWRVFVVTLPFFQFFFIFSSYYLERVRSYNSDSVWFCKNIGNFQFSNDWYKVQKFWVTFGDQHSNSTYANCLILGEHFYCTYFRNKIYWCCYNKIV